MAPKHVLISELSHAKENWNIVVRLVRLWYVPDMHRHGVYYSMEALFMDEKGDRIQASIRKELIYKFVRELTEGCVYSITGGGFASNTGAYRASKHQCRLIFQFSTKVFLVDPNLVRGSSFALVPIAEIGEEYNIDYLVDVVGFFSAVGVEKQYERNGSMTKMNVIELEDNGVKIECSLFGSYTDDLNNVLASGPIQNPVVIIQLAKVKIFRGKATLQNAINYTKILFNPSCNEATEFKKSVPKLSECTSQTLSQLQEAPKLSLEEEFFILAERKTIAELKDTKEDMSCVVMGTITHVLHQNPNQNLNDWWYIACVCNKAVKPDSNMYFCEKGNKHVMNVVPRYRIKVVVIDDTDCTTFVIFYREAKTILQKSCEDMLETIDKSVRPLPVPPQVQELVDKTFLFKVEVKNVLNSKFGDTYRVKKICCEPEIINKFKEASSSLEGIVSFNDEMVEGLADVDVVQDLMEKFIDNESQAECGGVVRLDLTQNNEENVVSTVEFPLMMSQAAAEVTLMKRSIEMEGEVPDKTSAKILKKEIKIEKDI